MDDEQVAEHHDGNNFQYHAAVIGDHDHVQFQPAIVTANDVMRGGLRQATAKLRERVRATGGSDGEP